MSGERLKILQDIMKARLPHINRWNKVIVCYYDSVWMRLIRRKFFWEGWPQSLEPTPNMYYVIWYDMKGGNIHEFDIRRRPLSFLNESIRINETRLNNKTKTTA